MVPVYFKVRAQVAAESLLLVLGLIGLYVLIHILVSRQISSFGPSLGAFVGSGVLVALYVAGASALPIVGHGEGQLAAVTFLSISSVLAGVRSTPGRELMAILDVVLGKHTQVACLIFSPLDGLERRLRSKRAQ